MARKNNPWRWTIPPESDGIRRLDMLVGGSMPTAYNLFNKLDALTAGYDEVTIHAFLPDENSRTEKRLYGCLKAWCKNHNHTFRTTAVQDFDSLSGYMQFIADNTDHTALALGNDENSRTLTIINSFKDDTDVIYKQIRNTRAA